MAQMLASQCDSSVLAALHGKGERDQTVMVRAVDGHAVPFSPRAAPAVAGIFGHSGSQGRSITTRLHQQFQSAYLVEIDYRQLAMTLPGDTGVRTAGWRSSFNLVCIPLSASDR